MRAAAVLVTLALALGVGGCGGNDVDSYCAAVESQRKEFAAMVAEGKPTALISHLPMLRDLASKAPSDLKDEWQTFLNAVEGLDDALRKADVDPAKFDAQNPPASVSKADLRAISEAAGQLSAADVVDAASGIDHQARDVCKINLGM